MPPLTRRMARAAETRHSPTAGALDESASESDSDIDGLGYTPSKPPTRLPSSRKTSIKKETAPRTPKRAEATPSTEPEEADAKSAAPSKPTPKARGSLSSKVSTPLPLFWYIFFGVVEPLSTLSGAVLALTRPKQFYLDQVPVHFLLPPPYPAAAEGAVPAAALESAAVDGISSLPPAAAMAIAQLGSCYLLLTLNGAVMFHVFRTYLTDPYLLQTVVTALLIVLGVADWIHIGVTLFYLPVPAGGEAGAANKLSFLFQPQAWNALLFGNVVITLVLFLFRAAWLGGAGRAKIPSAAPRTPLKASKSRGRPRKTPKYD